MMVMCIVIFVDQLQQSMQWSKTMILSLTNWQGEAINLLVVVVLNSQLRNGNVVTRRCGIDDAISRRHRADVVWVGGWGVSVCYSGSGLTRGGWASIAIEDHRTYMAGVVAGLFQNSNVCDIIEDIAVRCRSCCRSSGSMSLRFRDKSTECVCIEYRRCERENLSIYLPIPPSLFVSTVGYSGWVGELRISLEYGRC